MDRSEHHVSEVDGVRVVTEQVPSVRSVSIGVWVGVGSRDEAIEHSGYAHFLEHLLFKGNARYGAESISNYFDGIGSDANAATTKEYTVVHTRVLDRHVATSLDVIGNMVLAPGFDPNDLDAERQVILEEIAMYNDSPSDVVHELADELVFDKHPLGAPIVGNETTIEQADARSVGDFHGSHYTPGQLVVSAAGNIEHTAFVELVRSQFLGAADTPRNLPLDAARYQRLVTHPDGAPRARVTQKESEQVHICLAAPGISRSDPRRYAGAVLDTILGSTPSSRLFNEIRERRGLAYSVYSYLSHYADTGQIGIYVAVRPDRMQLTLEVLARELQTMRTTPPAAQELARAKDHLEGRMLLSMESTTVRGNRLGASLITGMPIEPISVTVERIRATTAEDIRDLAAELLAPERLAFAAVAEDAAPVEQAAASALGIDLARFHAHEAIAG